MEVLRSLLLAAIALTALCQPGIHDAVEWHIERTNNNGVIKETQACSLPTMRGPNTHVCCQASKSGRYDSAEFCFSISNVQDRSSMGLYRQGNFTLNAGGYGWYTISTQYVGDDCNDNGTDCKFGNFIGYFDSTGAKNHWPLGGAVEHVEWSEVGNRVRSVDFCYDYKQSQTCCIGSAELNNTCTTDDSDSVTFHLYHDLPTSSGGTADVRVVEVKTNRADPSTNTAFAVSAIEAPAQFEPHAQPPCWVVNFDAYVQGKGGPFYGEFIKITPHYAPNVSTVTLV